MTLTDDTKATFATNTLEVRVLAHPPSNYKLIVSIRKRDSKHMKK